MVLKFLPIYPILIGALATGLIICAGLFWSARGRPPFFMDRVTLLLVFLSAIAAVEMGLFILYLFYYPLTR